MRPFFHLCQRSAALAVMLLAFAANGQEAYPSKIISFVVPVPAGSVPDLLTRAIAEKLQADLKQTVIVENKGGAQGRIGTEFVKRAKPDGYTLLLGAASWMTINPAIYKNLRYDPAKDFQPITYAVPLPLVFLVNPDRVKASTYAEFLEWAKQRADKVSIASYGNGTPSHFAIHTVNRLTGQNFAHVPYNSPAQATTDLVGGAVDGFFDTLSSALPMIKAGKIKPLAIANTSRSPLLPDVPTFRELGIDLSVQGWLGYFAPANTPKPVVDLLNRKITEALRSPDMLERLRVLGMSAQLSTPEQLGSVVENDIRYWKKVAAEVGYVAD